MGFFRVERKGYATRWVAGPSDPKAAIKAYEEVFDPESRSKFKAEATQISETDFISETRGFLPSPNNGLVPQIIDKRKSAPKPKYKEPAVPYGQSREPEEVQAS